MRATEGSAARGPASAGQRGAARLTLLALAPSAVACGGAGPILHPAHPLAPDQLSAGFGVSGLYLAGEAGDAVRTQDAQPEGDIGPGTAAHAALAPALAPWLGIRVGLDNRLEGGLAMGGRNAHADVRHAWVSRQLALSAGLGASALLSQQASRTSYLSVGGVDTGSTTGWGLDVPILFGARSDARLVEAWAGPRVGYQHSSSQLGVPVAGASPTEDVGTRFAAEVDDLWAGAVLGLSFGLEPIWVVLEAQGSHHWLRGTYDAPDGKRETLSLKGISLAPAVAVRVETW